MERHEKQRWGKVIRDRGHQNAATDEVECVLRQRRLKLTALEGEMCKAECIWKSKQNYFRIRDGGTS